MPGSTSSSSLEEPKAKVTDSSATNGIFVRPVAVAGIFRPAEEAANKPPALPEKRRFSALSGDLRPCSTGSGVSNDDFARRRQSWDAKAKEVPFGQALLRKTPRNKNTLPCPVKSDLTSNGSSHEDISPNDNNSEIPDDNCKEKLNSKSAPSASHATSKPSCAIKDASIANDLSNKGKALIETEISKEETKSAKHSVIKNQKFISNETVTNVGDVKNVADSNVVKISQRSTTPSELNKNAIRDATVDKNSVSVDISKQPKKVYGLMKRDSKSETSQRIENIHLKHESKSDVETLNIENPSSKKESQLESSKCENTSEKATANVSDSSKIKKVYGLSKTNIKKDGIKNVKDSDASLINKSSANISASKSSESTVVNKTPEISTEIKPSEINVVNKPSEKKVIKPYENNKSCETKIVNKPSEVKIVDKISEASVINNALQVSSLQSKESTASKSPDSKTSVEITKIQKNNEFHKAQSPPKDFRTVRRTSDVIAAKIQNIFSNISATEKPPPPVVLKKSKPTDKPNVTSDGNCVKTVINNERAEGENSEIVQTTKQSYERETVSKAISKCPTENKSTPEAKFILKTGTKNSPIIDQELKTSVKGSDKSAYEEESKYKQQSQPSADHSTLKKENKLASESNDVLQSCKLGEVVTTRRVKTETSLEKADSKTERSINAVPSKAQDKKILNIGGKMPIKKQDQNRSDGTASLKATNQDDRKSSDSTAPIRTVMENVSKSPVLQTEIANTFAGSGEKVFKSASSSCSVNTSDINTAINIKNNCNVNKKIESNVFMKESNSSKSSVVLQTAVKTNTLQQIGSVTSFSKESSQSELTKIQKKSDKVVNGGSETTQTTEVSKIEVAKITPSTEPSVVPTVNVLFRTKSPQSSATKEENRKKVVVETYSSSPPIPSAVINASKVSEKLCAQESIACDSAKESVKSPENVQKSVNSRRLPIKHSTVNSKKEELAAQSLAATDSVHGNAMPPNTVKTTKNSSIANNNKTETLLVSKEKNQVSDAIISKTDQDKSVLTVPSNSDNVTSVDSRVFADTEKITENSDSKKKLSENVLVAETDITQRNIETDKKKIEMHKNFTTETKVNVVDLGEWNKKFQLIEPEPPRVPLRRRTVRDSMPPSLPSRSRFGSLKRIDDSTKYLPRSPSQSSLPRYSYTEMLSKVCSMGVLPFTEPSMSKSCSSSSSQVSELWSELSEEQSTATHTSEMLEAETTERMRLEKEVQELQNRCSQVQLRSDKMEMEMMEARVYRTPELNGDLSEDEDAEGNSSLYKQKYERAVRDMEIMKRRIQQQHEEEMEQKAMLKKASDKRLAEALEDVEEERQVANQWKRKAQKLGSELQDLRLMLEEQMARNGELEKKQRRFDAELSAAQEEIKKERLLREKFAREKDQALHEKYSLEQDLQSSRLDADTLHEKITQLNRELDELTLSSKGEEEVTQLKRAKQELERKCRDQEEELEELAAQVSMLEQAKLRLEMSLEKVRQEHRREASVREEEIEEIRASFSKKIKNLEAQLESEQDERHQLMKQKHELERRLYEIADQPPPQDPEIERRLRRDLKRTKALLRDAQSMLEHTREGQSGKTLIRQLKNQLEDSEFAKAAAVKARQAVESELQECQTQLEEATRVKNEVESRCLQLSREKSAIQTQLEEAEEEMAEVMKKYKAVVAQMSIDQKTLSEQNQQIADLETEKQMLKDQLNEVSHKFEHLAGQSEDTHKVHRLDGKIRDLESKLELEQTTRSRLEHQIARLKEQNDRIREECDSLRSKELQAQEGVRRLQRQMRELREDYSALQQKEAEAYRKQHELEMALENTETDLQVTKNDLRLACQRIQDLQNALEDDLDSGTDVPDDSCSDSDESYELAMLRNQSVTPTQRCDSAASNYSFASEGIRSRTSSFTQELSAFSRMILSRRISMDFLG